MAGQGDEYKMTPRRELFQTALTGAAGVLVAGMPHQALAADRLSIIAHAVHRAAATKGPGGDVTEGWREKNGGGQGGWLTFSVEATKERAFKEASLAQGNADIVFILDRYTGPQFAGLFEDLGVWQAKTPIPGFQELPHGMVSAHTFGGKLTAIPFRHATNGLHYNTDFFAERG